ncbi:MAG: hypothetical protein R2713_01515 [Ilumatobacteraceae bacterium]
MVRDIAAQHVQPRGIALHRPHVDSGVEQAQCQRTGAGAEIEDEFVGVEVERGDEARDTR